jgi:hypothetical protein
MEHKIATFRFHISKMYSLPLDPKNKQKECKIIQTIAKTAVFHKNLLQKLNRQKQQKINRTQTERKATTKSGLRSLTTDQRYENSPICSKTPT